MLTRGGSQKPSFIHDVRWQPRHVWHINAFIWEWIHESYRKSIVAGGSRFILTAQGAARGETQDGTANSSTSVMTAGLRRIWEKRKRFWWMTFRVRPLAIANSLPVPHRPDASYLLLREKWMNGPLWNKWSLPVWHLQMNPSCKTKSIYLFYCLWRWVECSRLCGCHVHSQQGWFKKM